jgi:hypothetical protein
MKKRRGQCRCGSILTFEKGLDGYKKRCETCGSVVRCRKSSPRPVARASIPAIPSFGARPALAREEPPPLVEMEPVSMIAQPLPLSWVWLVAWVGAGSLVLIGGLIALFWWLNRT